MKAYTALMTWGPIMRKALTAGWGMMVTPSDTLKNRPTFERVVCEGYSYALDNGAWGAFQANRPTDFGGAFRDVLQRFGAGADFVVVPDIVAGGLESLALSLEWLPECLAHCGGLALIAVQDGMDTTDIAPHVSGRVGLFVGGSTAWKLATLPAWAELAHNNSAWIHVGRVNTARRIRYCRACEVNSFDGSGTTRFPKTWEAVERARRLAVEQRDLFAADQSSFHMKT